MSQRTCEWCKAVFSARTADVRRGWARFCSKSCKAMRQEKCTGQYRAYQRSEANHSHDDDPSWDAHKSS